MPDTGEQLALDAAIRAIDRQALALDGLRARAGTLIAGSSLVAALLGTPAIKNDAASCAVVVGFLTFFVVLALALAILWPYQMIFRQSPEVILRNADKGFDYPTMQRYLAMNLEGHHDANEDTLRNLNWCVAAGCLFLFIETVAWLLGI